MLARAYRVKYIVFQIHRTPDTFVINSKFNCGQQARHKSACAVQLRKTVSVALSVSIITPSSVKIDRSLYNFTVKSPVFYC